MNQRLRISALFSLPTALLLSLSCGTSGQGNGNGTSGTGSGASTGSGAGSGTAAGSGAASTGSGAGSGVASTGAGGSGSTSSGSSGSGSTGSGASSGTASSGTAGSGASSGASSGSPAIGNSVLQRGPDLMRRETFIQPMLTKTAAAAMTMDAAFTAGAKFTGAMAASVLYLESGPPMAGCPTAAMGCVATTRTAGNGLFFAATNGGIVYALDETSGAIVWKATVMGPPPDAGNGDGIRGTPVIDPATRTLYVTDGGGGQHLVHALSVDDGTERQGWPVKLTSATLTVNGTAFNSVDENQHGAMMFANGVVYVPFGGHYGDGGTYHGWVVAIQASTPTNVSAWVSAGGSEGVWAHGGGMASDGTNIYVVTSNGHAGDHTLPATDAEEVIKFSGMGTFTRNAQNVYYPTNWKYMDQADRDFGADSPSYVPLPAGSTPSAIIVAPAKPGVVYFLDANNLSSGKYPQPGGELAMLTVANTTAESIYTAPTVYQSASGLHATINTEVAAVCPTGGPQGDKMILSMLLQPGATFAATVAWCAPASGNAGKQYNQPPISTTTDASGGNALVWYTNGGALTAVDGDTGKSVLPATGMCTGMEKMMWPIAVKGRIVVAADGHLCAWK